MKFSRRIFLELAAECIALIYSLYLSDDHIISRWSVISRHVHSRCFTFQTYFLITRLTVSITPKDRQIDKVVTTAIYTLCDYSRGVSFLSSKNHYRYFSKRAYSSENSWSRLVNGHRDYEISISCYKPAKSLLLEHLFSPMTVKINYSGATRQWGRSIVHFCRNAAWDFELQHLIETSG